MTTAHGTRRRLFVAKDEHKFSCAHMTLFPDGTKERLHGHNYRVSVSVEFEPEQGEGFLDFARVKATLAGLCAELREHLLMPTEAEAVTLIHRDDESTEMRVCGKRYVLPSDELIWLPMPNVVVEHLAEYLWGRIARDLEVDLRRANVRSMEVTVTEAPGQGATFQAAPGSLR